MEHKRVKSIKFDEVNFYSKLIKDYLSGDLKEKGLVDWDYSLEQLAKNKSRNYSSETRKLVHAALINQYNGFDLSIKEKEHLEQFSKEECYSITTGHQLMLIGGPMFFYTKIMDVVNLCKEISTSDQPVVPIFWMASEDHDYEEISKVHLFGKTLSCEGDNKGPVGRIPKEYFSEFLNTVNDVLGDGEQFAEIKSIINDSFNNGSNLSQITRIFVRELFKDEGLLIIDGDDPELKGLFREAFEKELTENCSHESSKSHIEKLGVEYKIQVKPRDINLFFIEDEVRKRIVNTNSGFSTPDAIHNWTDIEIVNLIASSPERISPNVILRPVYQEVLLPNLAYIGGAGEIAYWLELKPVFKAFNVDFPLPIVRNPYFIIPEKSYTWLEEQGVEVERLFEDIDLLVNKMTKEISSDEISFDLEYSQLKSFYEALKNKGLKVNPQLEKVVFGEEKRAISALQNVEKRFLKAEKQKHEGHLNKLKVIHAKLFPNGKPMERVDSFIPLLIDKKFDFKKSLKQTGSVFNKRIYFLIK
ncbi:MAG: bacillithiol biosynthesis cysteine-adding enzyme BshC [Flavobacteriales bacterium]|nr:bacillithiol biosynthesis cysteine-adding enzyme BshC [Flavobacteriales bacterium]|tara:strand:+ start:23127 stop:24713 length:1587 start_codon:yes stop_codon:yes gene_type:complete